MFGKQSSSWLPTNDDSALLALEVLIVELLVGDRNEGEVQITVKVRQGRGRLPAESKRAQLRFSRRLDERNGMSVSVGTFT